MRGLHAPFLVLALAFAGAVALSAQKPPSSAPPAPQTHAHDEHAHHHPSAAAMKNPVAATAESIAAGKALYARRCVRCHGETGKGDGPSAAGMHVADLTDAAWKHGDTDGEIFVLIRDGAQGGMPKFTRLLNAQQIWQLVNYVRSLGPQR